MDSIIQDNFPVDWQEDQYVSRREFVKFLTLASGGMAVASLGLAAFSAIPRPRIAFDPEKIGHIDELEVGGWKQFSYPRATDACLLIRTSEKDVVAYSRRCTHLSCPVGWQKEQNRLFCPCHQGAFSIEDGRVLQGPPERPLPKIELTIDEGGQIFAVGVTHESI